MQTLPPLFLKEYITDAMPFKVDGEDQRVPFFTRVDPLSGNMTKISQTRALRRVGLSADLNIHMVDSCDFCHYQEKTPRPHIEHPGGAVSVPNKFPWEKYDWITLYPPFGEHKLLLSELCFEDLERMVESSFDLALRCASDPDVLAMMDFTNWGPFAGASQQHPHSQRKSVSIFLDPRQERELRICKALAERYGANPFNLYSGEERRQGIRVIHDDEVFIAAAFAPTSPHEVVLFPNTEVAHILQTSEEERKRMVRPALGIFLSLFFYLGITDLNVVVHMAPLRQMEEARRYYRWHMHILPRRSRLPIDQAGAELGFDVNVIDTLPEATAETIRRWYREGPKEELLPKGQGGFPNPVLLREFRRLQNSNASR
jgi:galactose-1-phosphate uridylyltransferase